MAALDIALAGLAALVVALNLTRAAVHALTAVVEGLTSLVRAVHRLRRTLSSGRSSLLICAIRSTPERDHGSPSEPPRPVGRSTTRRSG